MELIANLKKIGVLNIEKNGWFKRGRLEGDFDAK